MTTPRFEAFLARLYVDEVARRRFLEDPERALDGSPLSPAERRALLDIDHVGLELAASSFERKRAASRASGHRTRRWRHLLRSRLGIR